MEDFLITKNLRTVSGKEVNVFNPDPETLVIEDIGHALAMQSRFGGHLPQFFSVAQHSVLCAEEAKRQGADAQLMLDCLMHDSSEAYLLDLPRPIKVQIPQYKDIENNLMRVLAEKFKFTWPMNPVVKDIDDWQLKREWNDLMMRRKPANKADKIYPESVVMAEYNFLRLFKQLTNG